MHEGLEIQTKNNSYSSQFRKFWDNFCLLAEAASIASLALVKHSSKRNLELNKQGLKSCYAHVTIPRLHSNKISVQKMFMQKENGPGQMLLICLITTAPAILPFKFVVLHILRGQP